MSIVRFGKLTINNASKWKRTKKQFQANIKRSNLPSGLFRHIEDYSKDQKEHELIGIKPTKLTKQKLTQAETFPWWAVVILLLQ